MHPQLAELEAEFDSASARLERLANDLSESHWATRPASGGWSAMECVAHLNLTSEAFLPVLRDGLESARISHRAARRRYRRDLLGWLIWRLQGPPVRFKLRTSAPFVPTGAVDAAKVRSDFGMLQQELVDLLGEADGRALSRVKIHSPFDKRVRYNLFSALSILPRHQHRHLWQAEQVRQSLERRG